jgi:primary-amine oxidase
VQRSETVSPKYHGNIDFIEVVEVEEITMKDPRVIVEIEKLKLPPHLEVIPEAWHFGSDGMPESERRQYQVYMFVGESNNPDSNYYARPLAFSPVVDVSQRLVTRIDYIPTGTTHASENDTRPWEYREGNEYVPEALKIRTDVRPLQIAQPEGTSFSIDSENVLQWQKWSMRVGFNYREGLLLRDIRYEGRPIFYRVSLSEMTVPYADPRAPYHRKQAFDLGDIGAGLTANNLALGCDCLGSITYLNGLVADPKGEPMVKENAICVHEQDSGIGWKHTNYRTGREFLCTKLVPDATVNRALHRCLRGSQP